MKRLFAAAIVLLMLAPATVLCQKKNVTVIGEVVDVISYVTKGVKPTTPDLKEVFDERVKAGSPVGILEASTGKLYLVMMKESNKKAADVLVPFAGMRIAANGDVYTRGSTRLLIITSVGKSIK